MHDMHRPHEIYFMTEAVPPVIAEFDAEECDRPRRDRSRREVEQPVVIITIDITAEEQALN